MGEAGGNPDKIENPEMRKTVKLVVDAVNKGHLPENTQLLRALDVRLLTANDGTHPNVGKPDKAAFEALVGKVLTDHAFGSTTTSEKIAREFMGEDRGRVVMRIDAPAGTKGMWIGNVNPDYNYEHEFVMPPGAKYLITGVGEKIGHSAEEPHYTLHARVLPFQEKTTSRKK